MLRNQWLRKIRLQEFKQKAEIVLFTTQVDEQCTDWINVALPGRYSWSDELIIALDDTRPVYGYYVYYEGQLVHTSDFYTPRYIQTGDTLRLYLDAEAACPC